MSNGRDFASTKDFDLVIMNFFFISFILIHNIHLILS